ncbi:ChbG/HpnK family deacetylase [Pseudomonas sp. BIGb0427]|uniref:carbohydrate deacetylase n=1 Tax=unclassified Pseudomonas TaxID=196821 RepID=UPI0018A7B0FD|nr:MULTISPECIES: ChbG/HpnK family deacetylase [unclassified Pseudomonas]QPG61733.1 ChbG/HpnK family deacetylase [Pseudomonas sp. BIGb0427]UVM69244.1 ChbG/HpnK family deacetylase [Pseudomonas sp. B21-009]
MPSQVIVNADDFGLSAHTNAVILHAFQAGLISSATAMANMPAFSAACSLAQLPALRGRIGLHFNLTYGRPLSQAIRQQPRFCAPNGEFDLRLKQRTLRLSRAEREAVEQELQAQWQHCLNQGLMPSHLDSHQHVHNIWPIGVIVARFAAREGVAVRLARNLGHNIGPLKRVFKTLLNRRLKQLAGATADYVCTPADLRAGLAPADGLLEVVAHPSALGGHDFGDAYLGSGESLKTLLEQRLSGVPRISYNTVEAEQRSQAIPMR